MNRPEIDNDFYVTLNLSFPEIKCDLLSIDVIDDMGAAQENAILHVNKHALYKSGQKGDVTRLHRGGSIREEKDMKTNLEKLNIKEIPDHTESDCGNCYGAGLPGQCCNTCDEVKLAYAQSGWKFKPQDVSQCARESFKDHLIDHVEDDIDAGCQIYGTIHNMNPSGHFHIAPHQDIHNGATSKGFFNLFDLLSFAFDQFNITHTVNKLHFGADFPGFVSPLDGQMRAVLDTHGMYQYYTKIVPTRYTSRGNVIKSNQYSVTEHLRNLAPGSGRGMPGVYFNYEMSPVVALYEEKRGSFIRFLTSVCAIIGGFFTIMGMFDSFIQILIKQFYSKSSFLS